MARQEQHERSETLREKKAWITPEIFDSPMIEVTEGTSQGVGNDELNYS